METTAVVTSRAIADGMTRETIAAPNTWTGAIDTALQIVSHFTSEEARQELGGNSWSTACLIHNALRGIRSRTESGDQEAPA